MIARMWHGRVRGKDADGYHRYLIGTGLADYAATPGNRGVELLRRDEGDVTHFITLTFWDSLDAVGAFAGQNHEEAVYYPDDDEWLLEREPFATHWEMLPVR